MGHVMGNLGHTRRMTGAEAEQVVDELLGAGYTRIHVLGRCNGGYVVGADPPPFKTERGSWPGQSILVWEPGIEGSESMMDRL